MKRRISRPIIFALPSNDENAFAPKPRILPFPGRQADQQSTAVEAPEVSNDELGEVRARLFRMIVANQWDRSHGNRAS